MTTAAATFAAVFVGLFVAHQVADHWVQTGHQAAHKHQCDRIGRLSCVEHVATYTVTTTVAVWLLWGLLDLNIHPLGFVAG